ncbi:MAG TPA: 7TM diverse intracellular signaling domain-containing protein [Spirochaetota bacterium]|nr:7TM diverse intracellular signaling domain-containing protein [Spirochaetota bacterium]
MNQVCCFINKGFTRYILFALILLLPSIINAALLSAAPVVTINDTADSVAVGNHMEYIEDKSGLLTFEDVTTGTASRQFKKLRRETPNFGYTSSVYWVRFDITYSTSHPEECKSYYLDLDYPFLDYIQCYIINSKGEKKEFRSGDMLSFSNRPMEHRNFIFPLLMKSGDTKKIYCRVKTESSMQFPFTLRNHETMITSQQKEYYLFGLYYGVMIIIFIYHLFFFFVLGDKSYFFYILYVAAYGIYQFTLDGFGFQYFWPEWPVFANKILPVLVVFACFTGILFSTAFLNLRKTIPVMYRVYQFTWPALVFFSGITLLFPYRVSLKLSLLTVMLVSASLFITGYVSMRKGNKSARFFILAWSALIIGNIIQVLFRLGVLPNMFFIVYAQQIGSLVGVTFFSFALGDRINTERREKYLAQQAALKAEMEAVDNLSKADRLKDEFLANTSHELRTPLTGIIGLAESLIDGATGPLPEETQKNLSMIMASGKRLSNLVNDILDFSKLKHEELSIHQKPVDIRLIIDMVITLLHTLVTGKDIIIRSKIDSTVPLVYGDENRIEQILYNLIGNAIKFTEHGSITISATAENGLMEITVSDTGIGIPRDRFEDIFKSFEQLDASTARIYGGTGLGLSITRKLVELHGGTIRVESEVGKGSDLIFTLPLWDEQQELTCGPDQFTESMKDNESNAISLLHGGRELTGNGHETTASPDENRRIILIVDDEPVNLLVITNHLNLAGFEILTATNGREALDLLETNPLPDLILLDIMMPRMTGYEVCNILREKYTLSELPIILLTAKTQIQDMVIGFEFGANDYLKKPFDKRELLARIDNLLTLKEAVKEHNQLVALQKDLEIAKKIQSAILPDQLPVVRGVDLHVTYFPMEAVGGDFYDFHIIDERHLGILVADVTGHGIPAALIASMVKIAFSLQKEIAGDPQAVLSNMNETLYGKVERQFVTALYAYIDLEKKTISVASAGHHPLLLWKNDTGEIIEINPRGTLIGPFKTINPQSETVPIQAGDRIILYTDGIIETRNFDGMLWGEDNLFQFIENNRTLSPEKFSVSVIDTLNIWATGKSTFEDDLTLITLDVDM